MMPVRGLVMAYFLLGQSTSPPPTPADILLARIRNHAAATLQRLPNFTCLETIERSRRRPPQRRHELIDIARLEVALVSGKELFAWPGSGRFDDREMRDLIPGGATGNGSFGLHARAVFLGARVKYEYKGITQERAREAHHYAYRVPREFSGFTLRGGPRHAVVGYTGEFWVDRQSLDILRLTVQAVDIPSELEITSHLESLAYQRVQLGEESYLLPQSSDLHMGSIDGSDSRNYTVFSACKQYSTQSVISFDDPEETARQEAARANAVRPRLPAGLELELAIRTPLEFGKTAVGDAVRAEVMRDAKLEKKVIVPKGAVLTGRLIHFEHRGQVRIGANTTRDVVSLGFEFDEVATREWRAPLYGTVKDVTVMRDLRAPLSRSSAFRSDGNGDVIGGYHPSGHNLIAVWNVPQLEQAIRLFWRTRGEPIKKAAQ